MQITRKKLLLDNIKKEKQSHSMSILITDKMLREIHLTEPEFNLEFALFLFQQKKISLGKASQFAHLTRLQFQKVLYSRQIPVHYDIKDFHEDLESVHSK